MSGKLTPEDIKSIEENFVLAHKDTPDPLGMIHRAFGHEWRLKALCEAAMEAMTEQGTPELTMEEIAEHRRRMNLLLPGADMTLCDKVCAAALRDIERVKHGVYRIDPFPDEAAALRAQRETQGGPGPTPQDHLDAAARNEGEEVAPSFNELLDDWIKQNFAGHGVAIRRRDEPSIPGEPLMSMLTAKKLTREAVKKFAHFQLGEAKLYTEAEMQSLRSQLDASQAARYEGEDLVERMRNAAIEWRHTAATAQQWDALRQILLQEAAAFIEQILGLPR